METNFHQASLYRVLMVTQVFLVVSATTDPSMQLQLQVTATGTPCPGQNLTFTCTSSQSPKQFNLSQVDWYINGVDLGTLNREHGEFRDGEFITHLTLTLGNLDHHTVISCGLPGHGFSNNFTIDLQTTPYSPVITSVNSLNTSISLQWTHNTTCFENVPVVYHVSLYKADTVKLLQSMRTGNMIAEIDSVISGNTYIVSVVAEANTTSGTQRSEADSETITAGYPLAQSEEVFQCFEQKFELTCYHDESTGQQVWLIDGKQVVHDGKDVYIDESDKTILLNLSRPKYAERHTFVQCCLEQSSKRVCGERYLIEPLENPTAPVVSISKVDQTSISLVWEVSNACFESLNFTVDISWRSAHVEGQAVNVSGNSYDITGLTPGVTYNITLVATGGGKRSDSVSISNTTLGPISGLSVGAIAGIVTGSALVIFTLITVGIVLWGWKKCRNKYSTNEYDLRRVNDTTDT